MRINRVSLTVIAAALFLVALAGAGAGTAMRAQPTAVAVVDLSVLSNQLNERTKIESDLQARQEDLQRQQEERKNQINRLQQDLAVLAPGTSAYQQKEQELQKAVLEFQVWSNFESQRLNRERGIQKENLYRKVLDAVAKVAQANGYDLVLFKEGKPDFNYENLQQLDALIHMRKVLYASESVDITSQVIDRMNNEFQAGQ